MRLAFHVRSVVSLTVRFVGYSIIPNTFLCEHMLRREIFLSFSLLVEIEGHSTHEFVTMRLRTDKL
jgi:hypothetical protein